MKTIEDVVFVYYGCPNRHWAEKCQRCRDEVNASRKPVKECIDCWKVEVWSSSPALSPMVLYQSSAAEAYLAEACGPAEASKLSESLESPATKALESLLYRVFIEVEKTSWSQIFCAKISKAPIQVVRSGFPRSSYPSSDVDYLLMLYAQTIDQRDFLLGTLENAMGRPYDPNHQSHGAIVPVRRGCWLYDDILGPWTAWYPIHMDYCG